MNEKAVVIPHFMVFLFLFAFSCAAFGAGYYVCYRTTVQPAGQSDDEFGKQLADKQRRIDELETRLGDIGSMVSDGFGNVSRTVGRISGQIDYALNEAGDVRTTISLLREAVKELEKSELYYRRLADRVSGNEHNSGSE
jgi:hypothetical protein